MACLLFGAVSTAQKTEKHADLHVGSLRVNRVLFLGNSITLHAPAPDIGWTGNWGMAASSEDKDYVRLLLDKIAKAAGGRPQFKVRNIAEFERGLGAFNIEEQLKQELEFRPDVVVLAIGENATPADSQESKQAFAEAFRKLLASLEATGRPKVFIRSQFWADPTKDELMKAAAKEGNHIWIDLSPLIDESCYARSERKFDHAGVAGHPGDKGMQVIADAIWKAISEAGHSSASDSD